MLRNLCYYGRHIGKKSPWAGLGLIEPELELHTAQIFKFSQNSGTLQLGSASLVPYLREAGVRFQSHSLNKVFVVLHHSVFKTQKIYIDGCCMFLVGSIAKRKGTCYHDGRPMLWYTFVTSCLKMTPPLPPSPLPIMDFLLFKLWYAPPLPRLWRGEKQNGERKME